MANSQSTKTLRVKDIIADQTIQIRERIDAATVEHYGSILDKLPPIDVFDTPDGLLVADGFTRLSAAESKGKTTIEANVRKGTHADAEAFAIIANTKHGRPLSIAERREGILRLHKLHPDWKLRQIADAMSVVEVIVGDVVRAEKLRIRSSALAKLPTSHLAEIGRAKEAHWEPLGAAAAKHKWSRAQTGDAVRALKNGISQKDTAALLRGDMEHPPHHNKDGEPAIRREAVVRTIKDARDSDGVLALYKALEYIAKLRTFQPRAIARDFDPKQLNRLKRELRDAALFLSEIESAMDSKKLEAIK
jgi:ParB-like chromosome segregation protein Spo0J